MWLRSVPTLLMLVSIELTAEVSSSPLQSKNISHMATNKRPTYDHYLEMREKIVKEHASHALGADVQLTAEEVELNRILMEFKDDELTRGFENPFNFTPARHFFDVLKAVESSQLFHLIRKMPKGAVLHAHDTALCSTDYVISLLRWDHLWQRGDFEGSATFPEFLFSRKAPADDWRLVSEVRAEIGDANYDAKVRRFFTLIIDDPSEVYSDINTVWSKFMSLFMCFGPIVCYTEAWKDYYRQALQEFYDDGVQFLEFRGLLPETYDLDGNTYGPIQTAQMYVDVLKEFKSTHPDFVGSKFVYAPLRAVDDDGFAQYLPILKKLQSNFPDFIAGFDLVGQEDKGRPYIDFAEKLLKFPEDVNFFFHAGETNWLGCSSDENLIDAVLLGSKRIGHGFALVKYPSVLKIVKEKRIGIEVNPISNQVLKLVDDIRNHPASILFSDDYPVVISSDDPSFWGALPLSHDFYYAFLGIMSAKQDLRALKKIIMNSFDFSSLSEQEKLRAKEIWNTKWQVFIRESLKNYKKSTHLITN